MASATSDLIPALLAPRTPADSVRPSVTSRNEASTPPMVASDAAAELPSRRTASSALSQAPTMAALIAATFSAIRSPVALDSSGQLAHLGRHHREPAAELAGAGGLDGRVQGQKAGLAGDALHVLGHLVELLGPAAQLLDLGQHGRAGGVVGGIAAECPAPEDAREHQGRR